MAQGRRFADPMEQLKAGEARVFEAGGVAPDQQLAPIEQQNMATPFAEAILARRADKPRDPAKIKNALKAEAAAWGNKWMYGWDVKDRQNNRTTRVEGGTIKMANAIARHFGNCIVETRVFDEGTHWTFYARFVDLETGYTLVRAYRQRKEANIGMKDSQRALDIVFAIGQSKAIRNVVLNALPDLEAFCREEAKSATIAEIEAKPDGARKWILKKLEEMGVERRRIEAVYGRTAEHWTVPDMAKIVSEVESVEEGMMNAMDVWPEAGENQAGDGAMVGGAARGQNPAQPPQQLAQQAKRERPSDGKTLLFWLEDGTQLPHNATGADIPAPGSPIELGGKLHHVVRVANAENDPSRIHVTVRQQKIIEAPKEAPASPAAAAGAPPANLADAADRQVQGQAKPAAAPKRNLFGKKGG
jgi:hypothetical protein